MADLTGQQRLAVECRDASVVLASGAGCGKTHVLTERYLDHLRRDGVEVGQLLAITFTDRAARQMRGRIRRAVAAELRRADDAMADRWARHLRGLETAHVSTIHAFCSSLLRQHAVEAGLDPGFEVLEEVLATNLRQAALTQCLHDLLAGDRPPGDDLRELIVLYGWPGVVRAVTSLLGQWQPADWQAWLEIPAEQVAGRWLGAERRRLLPEQVDYLIRGQPKVARCLRLLETTPCLGPKMRNYIALILHQLPRLAQEEDLETAVNDILGVSTVRPELDKAWPTREIYETIRDALAEFRGELRSQLGLFIDDPEELVEAVRVGQRFLRVTDAVARAYRQRKRAEGVVDFEDLLAQARDLLRDQAEVRAAVQRRYRFILIDELQDTDPVQHELVAHLCGDGLTAGKLFAVGDHQQSIYRFRGAAVERFRELRQRVPEAGRLPLSVNFRSQPAILDFANALFARHLREFQALEPFHGQANPGACVEFLWNQESGVRGQESGVSTQRPTVKEQRVAEADRIARRIRQMLDDQELLVRSSDNPQSAIRNPQSDQSLRAVKAGDIALLFRTMSHVGIYESALRRYGIDYYLVGGRAFFAQQEIYDLLHLLRALENPQDELSLAGTLRSPFCCLSDEALLLLARQPAGLWSGLHDPAVRARLPADQVEPSERAARWLDRWRALKDRLPIARLLGEVFADSGYDAAMQFEHLGERQLANLWKLQEIARAFDRSGRFGLAEFIARLGDLVASQPREEQAATQPEKADVVRLMSIHQAKGLEFPVVILPDLASAGRDPRHAPVVWHPSLGCVANPPKEEEGELFSSFGWELWKTGEAIEDWHEELRILYVACTRAEDYLVLSASLPEPFQPGNAWMLLLSDRFDIATGECRDQTIPETKRPRVKMGELRIADRGLRIQEKKEQATIDPSGAGAIPVRLRGGDVVALAGLESFLRCRQEGGAFNPALLVCSNHDESVLRAVLDRWDFRDPQGWRPIFVPGGPRDDLETMLARFAKSETAAALAQAAVIQRNLEYVLKVPGPAGRSLFDAAELPGVQGTIDCLWQDQAGSWHLLGWAGADSAVERRRLAVAALALAGQTGTWPASASLHDFTAGKTIHCSERELRQPALWTPLANGLRDLLEQESAVRNAAQKR